MTSIAGATTRQIKVGDLDIAYLEAGEGTPLLLLHGGLATAKMSWGDAQPRLSSRYRVLAPDSRGHGGTSNPSDRLSYDQMADDVAGFIDALGIEKPILVGYSDGGQVALEFGLRYPGKARALVLGGTVSQPGADYRTELTRWGFLAPDSVDYDRLADVFGPFLDTIKVAHGGGVADYWRRFLPQMATLWHTMPAYAAEDLARITDPALVIMGDGDALVGLDEARRLTSAIAGAELAVVPGASHDAVNRPVFWDLVEDFLARN
jgi:pimeloyl-ACP methyl ester carboxylesterase